MRTLMCIGAICATAPHTQVAHAHPDGAPWGAARPSAAETCTTCHFDGEPVQGSTLLQIGGLPNKPEPGQTYDLKISLSDSNAAVVGFQLIAQAEEGEAGAFISSDINIEFIGSAIRSTTPAMNSGVVSWTLQWRVPTLYVPPITLLVAAAAANDDGSPLGDQIYFRSYTLPKTEPERHY